MKTKPTQVIVHRIEFQQREREILDNLQTAYIGRQVVNPIVEILKDVSAMATITTLYLIYRYGDVVAELMGDSYDSVIEVVKDGQKAVKWAKENEDKVKLTAMTSPVTGQLYDIYQAFDIIFG